MRQEIPMVQAFKITGLHCAACTKLTAKHIKSLPGVADVTVDLHTGRAEVTADRNISLNVVNTALAGSDYTAEEYHE